MNTCFSFVLVVCTVQIIGKDFYMYKSTNSNVLSDKIKLRY